MPKVHEDPSVLPKMRIIVVGDGGVGKSAITIQFIQQNFVEYHDPTIEATYYRNFGVDGEFINLEIQDTAGQEDFASMRESYYRRCDGVLIVFSITSKESFDLVRQFRDKIIMIKEKDNFPILLVANKIDLDSHRKVYLSEIEALAKELNIDFIETSAKDPSVNIENTFAQIVRKVRLYPQTETIKPKPRTRKSCTIV